MAKMIMAAFPTPADADRALTELEKHGYTPDDISVISKDNKYQDEGYDTGGEVVKSAAGGAATGGIIGGLAGLLAGAGVFPAIAGLFIGGPIAAALGLAGTAAATASGAVTGAAAGGLVGALTGLGMSKESASDYDDTVKSGGVVLGLSGRETMIDEARSTLESCGADDVQVLTTRDTARTDAHDEAATEADTRTEPMRTQPVFGERREVKTARETRVEDSRDDVI